VDDGVDDGADNEADDGGHMKGRMKGFLISAAAGLLACTAHAAGAAPSQTGGNIDLRLTFKGVGPIRIGQTAAQLERMGFTGEPKYEGQSEEEYRGCRYMSSKAYPGLFLMLNDEKLVRVEVHQGDWQTLSGARLAMTKEQVQAIYGSWLRIEPHPYGGPGIDETAYLRLTSANGKYGAVFEVEQKLIGSFRLGLIGPVGYIEGCS